MSDEYVRVSSVMESTNLSFDQIVNAGVQIFYSFQRVKQETQNRVSEPDKYDWGGYFLTCGPDKERGEGYLQGGEVYFKDATFIPASPQFIKSVCLQNIERQSAVIDFMFLENREFDIEDSYSILSSGRVPINVYVPIDALYMTLESERALSREQEPSNKPYPLDNGEELRQRALLFAKIQRVILSEKPKGFFKGKYGDIIREYGESKEDYCCRLAKLELVLKRKLDIAHEKEDIDKEDYLIGQLDWIRGYRIGEHDGFPMETKAEQKKASKIKKTRQTVWHEELKKFMEDFAKSNDGISPTENDVRTWIIERCESGQDNSVFIDFEYNEDEMQITISGKKKPIGFRTVANILCIKKKELGLK